MAAPTAAFKGWLKNITNDMKLLSSDASVLRLTKESITNFEYLTDFDKKSLKHLPSTCKEKINAISADLVNGIVSKRAVQGANLSSISVRRLIVAMNASEYYTSIDRAMTVDSMNYNNM
mmetsp:Transcript_4425/g.6468  ORF Transcript_4425/g.6468 Transcript_4425/m.6468 type:complete len:119 (-) Transcript_4425:1609-1965(-)